MSQSCAPSQSSYSIQRLQAENGALQRYLEAQKKVIASLERRAGQTLQSLGVHVQNLSAFCDDESTWRSSLSSVQSEVDGLCDLLADAMLLQKIEAGKVEVHLESLDLKSAIASVTRHLLVDKDGSSARLICDIEETLPAVLADQELLEAVLVDLVARSLRYSDSTSPTVVSVNQADDAQIHLCVTAQRFAPVGNRDFATEIVLCCRRVEVQNGQIHCQQRPDGLQTVTISLHAASKV